MLDPPACRSNLGKIVVQTILAGIEGAVDNRVRIRVKPNGTGIDTGGVKTSTNLCGEFAPEGSLRIKEARNMEEFVVVSTYS